MSVIHIGEFINKSSSTDALTFNIIFKLYDKSSSDCRDDAIPQDNQRNGGRGNAFGGGASKHLLPANSEAFGGDDDAVDDAALKPPGLDR